jgi:hypothetical protein
MSVTYRFIGSKRGVHVEFITSPFWTLCGWQFDLDGNAVSDGPVSFGNLFEPFTDTDETVVTCPDCAAIIALCKTIPLEPLQEERFDEDAIWREHGPGNDGKPDR